MTRDPAPAAARRVLIRLYVATLAAGLLWIAAIVFAPWLAGRAPRMAAYLYACFTPLCHQIPERSFTLFGYPLAVCARCTGLYAGALAGLIAYPRLRGFAGVRLPDVRLFFLLAGPIAVDAAARWIGLWSSGNAVRFLTAFAAGSLLPYYFLTGVGEWLLSRRHIEIVTHKN
jgi:uncharacterized membrane protein